MQIAILAALILIAVIMAPWLIGVAAALAAAYGAYVIAIGVIAALMLPAIYLWIAVTNRANAPKPVPKSGGIKVCRHCQSEMPDYIVFCHNCHNKL